MSLAGRPILGHVVANCPTHALTFAFPTELMRHPECGGLVPIADVASGP
ncbi:hypothetical protein ACQVP2_30695 [Methylobacterium aquaticum]|nr:hypothetical protein [Methylobacterium aquaticum]